MRRTALLILAIVSVFCVTCANASSAYAYSAEDVETLRTALLSALDAVPTAAPTRTPSPLDEAIEKAFSNVDQDKVDQFSEILKSSTKEELIRRGIPQYHNGVTVKDFVDGYFSRLNWIGITDNPDHIDGEKGSDKTTYSWNNWFLIVDNESQFIISADWYATDLSGDAAASLAAFLYTFSPTQYFNDTHPGFETFVDTFPLEISGVLSATEKKPFSWPLGGYLVNPISLSPLSIHLTLPANW